MKQMKLVFASTLALTLNVFAGEVGSLDKSLAQTCLSQDLEAIKTKKPFVIQRDLKNYNFQSELLYQIALNRAGLVDTLYLSYHKEFSKAEKDLDKRRDELQKIASDAFDKVPSGGFGVGEERSPEAIESDKVHEQTRMQIEKLYGKLENYKTQLTSPAQINNTALAIQKNLEELAQTSDKAKETLKDFLIEKSYGDKLISIYQNSSSCEQMHNQYKELALTAKKKNTFKLATISELNLVKEKGNEKQFSDSTIELLKQSGYVKAAEQFKYNKDSSLTFISIIGMIESAKSLVITNRDNSNEMQLELGPKNQNLNELESRADGLLRSEMIEMHSNVGTIIKYLK